MNNRKLIAEDLKRYKQLLEYTFYVPEDKEEDLNGDLLLDDSFLTEQDPAGDDPFMDLAAPGEEPVDAPATGDTATTTTDTEEDVEIEDEFADTGDTATDTNSSDSTVEVDVTDIVDNTEATKTSVEGVSSKMDELLSKLTELESQVTNMDQVITKIDTLEKEIEKRNPTPVERLEMRSMQSFPYSVKLTDFWADKEGYDATGENEQEYVLRQSDVENYDKNEIKGSFDGQVKDEEM